jgi:hypothetical protein
VNVPVSGHQLIRPKFASAAMTWLMAVTTLVQRRIHGQRLVGASVLHLLKTAILLLSAAIGVEIIRLLIVGVAAGRSLACIRK